MNGLPNHDLLEDLGSTIDKPPTPPKKRGRKPKPKPIAEISGGTGGTASNGKASNGNTAKCEGVTAVDLNTAIDPVTTPPETLESQSPPLEQRPCYRCHADFWQDGGGKAKLSGVWWHGLSKGDDPQAVDTWICGEMHIVAIARDKAGRSFGQVLRFKNKLHQWQIWNMPTRLLAGRGDELLKELLDMGLAFNYHKRAQIAAYISSVTPDKKIWTAAQVGWFDDSNSFVLPDATLGKGADDILFQAESNHHQEYGTAGTLEAWRKQVAALCLGNPLLMFTVSVAFAGALLKPCNMDGVGFHIFGESSRGKTTGLKLAASVWGHWEKYKRVWKATANGLEGAAALFNDGLLTLDEIGDGDPKEISDALYLLGNGSGKQRANVLGNAKAVKTWRVAVLSNGEKTIEAHLSQKGLTMKAGQLVRFLQLPLFGQHGAFDALHGYADGRGFADAIVKNAAQHYGTAGRHWLEKLTDDPDTLATCSSQLDDALKRFAAQFGGLTPQEARAAKAFALVGLAGELATDYGVTGWQNGAAFDAALNCFGHWRGYRGEGDTEPQQVKEAITAYIEAFGDARFTSILDDTRLHGERSGYWRDTHQGREWLLTGTGLKQAAKGFDLKQVETVLKAIGWLVPDNQGKTKQVAKFKNNESGESRFYIIRPQGEGSAIDSNTSNTAENIGVTAKARAVAGGNTANTSNTGKTVNTKQVGDWGQI